MKKHSDIYFDHISQTPFPLEAKEQILQPINTCWASPYAPYPLGQKSCSLIEESKSSLLDKLQTQKHHIQLTHSLLETIDFDSYTNVLLSSNERQCVLEECFALEEKKKLKISLLPIGPCGYIEQESIEEALIEGKNLLLLPSVDLGSGVLQPLFSLQTKYPLYVIFDLSHTFGKTHFSFEESAADELLFSLQPIGSFLPLVASVSKEERFSRESTPFEWNLANLLITESLKNSFLFATEVVRLRTLFETEVKKAIPDSWILHQEENRIPHLTTIIFPKVKNEALLFLLSQKKLFASIGGGIHPTLASQLLEQDFAPNIAQGAMSFSFSHTTTEEEILESIERIKEAHELLLRLRVEDE